MTADAPSTHAPRRFRITTPGDWITVDAELFRQAADRSGSGPPELARAMEYLRSAASVFDNTGVVFAAFLVAPPSTDAVATVSSYVVGMESPGLDELVAEVTANPPADAVEKTLQVSAIDAPNGRTVRAECLRRSVLAVPSRDAVSLSVEYFLPLAGGADMLVTSFATPNVQQTERYRELFDSIAGSIELL